MHTKVLPINPFGNIHVLSDAILMGDSVSMIRTLMKKLGLSREERGNAGRRRDFVAVGFPKTGNTWTRIMLGRYVQQVHGLEDVPLFDSNEMTELSRSGYRGATGVFTHHPLTWEMQVARDLSFDNVISSFLDKRVIFLTRHPLDTLVSHFMHAKFKVPSAPYPGTLAEFIIDPVYGLDKLFRFYEVWASHHADVSEFFLWRYEDVRRDQEGQLKRLLAFLGEEVNEVAMRDAIQFSSFENLKAMESSGKKFVYKSSGFDAFGEGPRDDPNAFHIRKGQVGGYRDELPAELVAKLEQRVKSEMPTFFGYS